MVEANPSSLFVRNPRFKSIGGVRDGKMMAIELGDEIHRRRRRPGLREGGLDWI